MWEVECPNCLGIFIHDEDEDIQCPFCDHVLSSKHRMCNDCNGTGEGFYQDQKCLKCSGAGVLKNEQSN